jgi:dTDP-glucose 4,6-dehydratase
MIDNILITGGCGFFGSHFVEYIYKNTNWNIYVVDKLSYVCNGLERIDKIGLLNNSRVVILEFDLSVSMTDDILSKLKCINYIVHIGADSHVDYSISKPVETIYNNVMSTVYLLEYARKLKDLKLFLYFSTDEVYGSTLLSFKEVDRDNPCNPYAASKSASEKICISYLHTYNIPVIITNCVNIYGERQYEEKFIPKCIKYIIEKKVIDIYTNNENICGSRCYIYAENVCNALMFVINNGIIGEIYNIPGEKEFNNLELAKYISDFLKMPLEYELKVFSDSRPVVDFRYCLDGTKLYNIGWKENVMIENLDKTILSYLR